MESTLFPDLIPDGTMLIETFGMRLGQGAVWLDLHLDRMAHSAKSLGFKFDRDAALAKVAAISNTAISNTGSNTGDLRCRLTLTLAGHLDLTCVPMQPARAPWRVALAPDRIRSDDPWLQHKTTCRSFYDQARAALPPGIDEWLFLNEQNDLCEGTITNLFLGADPRDLRTPAQQSGLLPGILRQHLITQSHCVEARLNVQDLQTAPGFFMGNSLRGLIPAVLVRP